MFERTLHADPSGIARAAQMLGADVSPNPDGSLKVTVEGSALNRTEMREVLDYYQKKGGTIRYLTAAKIREILHQHQREQASVIWTYSENDRIKTRVQQLERARVDDLT